MLDRRWIPPVLLCCASLAALVPACEDPGRAKPRSLSPETAAMGAALSLQIPEGTDVAGFKVLVTRTSCGGKPFTVWSELVESSLLDLDFKNKLSADGSLHPFADVFVSVEAGCYDVLSQPVQANGAASEECAIAGQNGVPVLDGQTTEIVLVSQCDGQIGVGAADVISTLNNPPQLTGASYPMGKFVAHCKPQQVCATFDDPDGDPIEMEWSQIGGVPLVSLTPLAPVTAANGAVTQCVEIKHAGPGMVLLQAVAYDLMKNPYGPGFLRFEDFYAQNGIPATSHDSQVFQAYGANSSTCACVPNAEVCDGADNDCDGANDDGLPGCICTPIVQQPCYSGPAGTQGIGVCKPGVKVCLPDGSGFGACNGEVLPGDEVCGNGKDDDCDGLADENVPETCNGADDDCDGLVDEGGVCGCSQNEGLVCVVPGGKGICAQGVIQCDGSCDPIDAMTETCNGTDDDCDGLVDEDLTGGTCSAGTGICAVSGVVQCLCGQLVCSAVPGAPQTEVPCNGVDEDCDGADDCGMP